MSPIVAVVRKEWYDKFEGGNFLPDPLDRDLFLSKNFVNILHNAPQHDVILPRRSVQVLALFVMAKTRKFNQDG
jgi:hypothetical protein